MHSPENKGCHYESDSETVYLSVYIYYISDIKIDDYQTAEDPRI